MVSFPDYKKMCFPAKIYLFFSLIEIVFEVIAKVSVFSLLFNILFVGLWTWLLNTLCLKGFEFVSWVLVLLPFIVAIGLALSVAKTGNVRPATQTPYKVKK
jgi:hypothetical protein